MRTRTTRCYFPEFEQVHPPHPQMLGKLRKLKGRSFDELRERAAQALAARLEARGIGDSIGELSDAALLARLDSSMVNGSVAELHAQFLNRASPRMFAGIRDGSTRAAFATSRWDAERADVERAARRAIDGHYQLLGYPDLDFGNPVDWHFDPVARMTAPREHWSRIPYLNASAVGDHKVIWEINRHQHFYTLGRAYQASGNPQYAECFAQHITAWMNANPPKDGINWASSLEVSYRSISWMWALEFFRDSSALTPALLARIFKYAYVHGRHLERYLSTYFSPNTHLTGEALGLLYLGTCLPELACAARWRERGWKVLAEQAMKQVHGDGVYFEQTTYYHRYTVDIYMHAMLLARSNNIAITPHVIERLQRLASALADMSGAHGTTPLIGDDDGGHLVLLEERALEDVRASLVIASVVLGKPELASVARAVTEEVLWTLGADGVRSADNNLRANVPAHTSKLFSEGGYAVMRDAWNADALHAVVDCGPLGTMNCGHGHADTLSAEFSVAGREMLVDPGTYSYTTSAKDRDWFRHTAMHNSVTIDGNSSSVPAGPFSWRVRTDATVDSWFTGVLTDYLVAHHDGFMRLPTPARHTRTVLFVRGEYWVVVDVIAAEGESMATAHWHCAIGTEVVQIDALQARLNHTSKGETVSLLLAATGNVNTLHFGQDWVSRAYGARTLAPSAKIESRGNGTRTIVTVICPVRPNDAAEIQSVPATNGHALTVRSAASDDLIIVPNAGEVAQVHEMSARGTLAFIRCSAKPLSASDATANLRRTIESFALFGSNAELNAVDVVVRTDSAIEGTRDNRGFTIRGEGRADIVGGQ